MNVASERFLTREGDFVITKKGKRRALGGPGSGNFGHAGRPGEVGGSAPSVGLNDDGTVTLLHGTTRINAEAIEHEGFKPGTPAAVAHAVEREYGLPENAVLNNVAFEFARGRQDLDRIHFTTDPDVAAQYTTPEVLQDALAAVWLIQNRTENATPEWNRQRAEWIKREGRRLAEPVILAVTVPWDAVGKHAFGREISLDEFKNHPLLRGRKGILNNASIPISALKGAKVVRSGLKALGGSVSFFTAETHEPKPRAAARQERPIHAIADSYHAKIKVAVAYAFALGRKAVDRGRLARARSVRDISAAMRGAPDAIHDALLDVLPNVLAELVTTSAELKTLGGPGSGNFGHAGRPGEVGGSAPSRSREGRNDFGRGPVIRTNDIGEAVKLILEGKDVELEDVGKVHTVLTKLAEMGNEAKRLGKDAPNYDLCQVSVAGTNLFCAEGIRTKPFPQGIPRLKMPQLGGAPVPGSAADKLPRNWWDKTEVDGGTAFRHHLEKMGLKVESGKVSASELKASQRELVGHKVAAMMQDTSFDPATNPVFISRDNYVVDGHHRWAAVVARDLADAKLGDLKMNVYRVDAPISTVLRIAKKWSKDFGIKQVGGVKRVKRAAAAKDDLTIRKEAKVGRKTKLIPPAVDTSRIQDWAEDRVRKLAKGLAKTTREHIAKAVEQAFEDIDEGKSWATVQKHILDAVGDDERAELIAQTEIMAAANAGQRVQWDQQVESGHLTGDEKRVWVTFPDACPLCDELEGETADLDGLYPGDIEGPPLHPRCRCIEELR